MTAPRDAFNELMEVAPHSAGKAYRLFPAAEGVTIRVWVDGQTRLPGLTVMSRGPVAFRQAPAVQGLSIERVHDAQAGADGIIVACSALQHVEVFIELSARLIERAQAELTGERARESIINQLNIWASFFQRPHEDGLSRERQLGLIGEMLCLKDIAVYKGLDRAVEAWQGPRGGKQDFQWPGCAVEAKLTTSSTPERIEITSAQQLETEPDTTLLLYVVLATETSSDGVTVNELAALISAELSSSVTQSMMFADKLAEAGYLDSRSISREIRVKVRRAQLYHVTDDFPKIDTKTLKEGIFDVRYALPLSSLSPFGLAEHRMREVLS